MPSTNAFSDFNSWLNDGDASTATPSSADGTEDQTSSDTGGQGDGQVLTQPADQQPDQQQPDWQQPDQPDVEPLAAGKDVKVTFKNTFGQSRYWWIEDIRIDPNKTKPVFEGYLDDTEETTVTLRADSGGSFAMARYKRSDGNWTTEQNIKEGDTVKMS
jgi:hypothetical protein